MERIDKILTNAGLLTRKEAKTASKKGRICVNGTPVKSSDTKISDEDILTLDGKVVDRSQFHYIIMNKPAGYICSTDDITAPTVMSLISNADLRHGMFPVGRLDKYTVGLLLITNNGQLAHNMLSPKKHVEKTYYFKLEVKFNNKFTEHIENGIKLDSETVAKPAKLQMLGDNDGYITVTEGMFHLVKRIFEAAENKVIYLQRTSFGPLNLDNTLCEGEYRFLTQDEVELLAKFN